MVCGPCNGAKEPDPFLTAQSYARQKNTYCRGCETRNLRVGKPPATVFRASGRAPGGRAEKLNARTCPLCDDPVREGNVGRQYEEMASYENLYRAWKLARRGKSADHEVQKFALEASARLWKLHDSLEKRQYQPMGYYHFTVYEPKKREIYAPYFEDRVVQHSLCDNVLRPWMEARLIYDCAACRIGKGTHFAMDRLSGFLREFYREHGIKGYVLKCDIRKYFDNVDHDILKKRLSKFPDKEVLHLLHQFIDAHGSEEGKGFL